MKLTITIELKTDELTSVDAVLEVVRILRFAAGRVYDTGLTHKPGNLFNLRDSNGNTVGSVDLIEDDE